MSIKLDPLDLNFINLDTASTRQVIASYCILSKCPDFSHLKQRMENVVDIFPRLRYCYQPGSQPSWVLSKNFNLENHLHFIHNPTIKTRSELDRIAFDLFIAGVDFANPLWKFTLISNHLIDANCQNPLTAIIFVVHHSLADGLGGLEILNALSDSSAIASISAETKLASSKKHQHRYFSIPRLHLLDKLRAILSILRELCSRRPQTLLNGSNSAQRGVIFIDFDLQELKQLKRELKCSLNHLFLALISSAVYNFHKKLSFPLKSLRAIIPFNIRATSARHQLGNHLTGVALMLPTMITNIRQQLELIIKRTNDIQTSRSYGVYYVLGRINALMPMKIQPFLCRNQASKTNFICTNVPGPRKTQFIAGAEVKKNYCIPALMHGHGVGFSIFTYVNSAHICAAYDPNILKEPQLMVSALIESKNSLIALKNKWE